jgi:hypothetical protein
VNFAFITGVAGRAGLALRRRRRATPSSSATAASRSRPPACVRRQPSQWPPKCRFTPRSSLLLFEHLLWAEGHQTEVRCALTQVCARHRRIGGVCRLKLTSPALRGPARHKPRVLVVIRTSSAAANTPGGAVCFRPHGAVEGGAATAFRRGGRAWPRQFALPVGGHNPSSRTEGWRSS